MKKRLIMAICFLASSLAFAGTGVDYFYTDLSEAKKVAEKQNKPLYIHFTTEWCGWCRKIENEVYTSEKGKKALKPYVPVSLDCTVRNKSGKELKQAKENKKLMEKWGGSGYPYLVQVTPQGEVFNSFAGYLPPKAFAAELEEALESQRKREDFEKKTESASKDSYEYNVKAMGIYSDVGASQKALDAANKVLEMDPDDKRGNNASASLIKMKMLQDEAEWGKAGKALEDVREYDPKNKEGLWEEGLRSLTTGAMRNARSMPSAQRRKVTGMLLDMTKDLVQENAKLQKPQLTNYFLGMLYLQSGNREKGVQQLEKSIKMNPESDIAKQIKRVLQQVN